MSVSSVTPGHTKERMPKRIATIPRSRISHQYFASTGRIGAPIGAEAGEGAVDMSNLPFVSRPGPGPGTPSLYHGCAADARAAERLCLATCAVRADDRSQKKLGDSLCASPSLPPCC